MARFPHVRAAFNQTAFIESLNLPHQVLADIWLPVGFAPVSFEPLNEEEEKVAQTGQFTNANIRSRNNPNYNQGSSNSPGEFRTTRSNNSNASGPGSRQQGNRTRGGSFVAAANTNSNPRGPRQEFSDRQSSGYHNQQHRHSYDNMHDEVIEDPDNLWATPSSDAIGSSDFGTFDANGMFRTGAAPSILDGGLEDFASSSAAAAAAFEGFMQTRPHHAPTIPQVVPVQIAAPVPPPPAVAIPHITPDTQWLYRDPSGQIQGPFPSYRMLEWYNGKYFPENLPLRREQDAFFEPLSTWKTKCAGQIPFAAYTKEPEKPVVAEKPAINAFGNRRTENISISQWFASEPVKSEKVEVSNKVAPVPAAATISAPSNAANSATVASSTSSGQQPRSVPIESLFSGIGSKPVVEKTPSPEVMMPGSGAGWKKLEKPSITAKFGQLDINQPETEASIMSASKSVEPELKPARPAPVASSVKPTEPAKQTEAPKQPEPAKPVTLAASSWSNSSASNGSLKKISLSEILKSSEEPNIVLEKEKLAPAAVSEPVLIPTNSAGWAKLSASPVQSLSTIQAEEAARQRAANPSGSSAASSASKSFADLVRSAGVITSGDIIVSPVVERGPLFKERPAASASTHASAPVSKVANQATSPASNTASAPKTVSVEDWCLASLKQSPLAKSIDPQTCTILLMDLPNPAAILTFALETLKPIEGNFDLATFAQELSMKKFGAKANEKVQWTKLKTVPQVKKQEESFEVVKRKK